MKKIVTALVILALLAIAAWAVLFRKSDISDELLTSQYGAHSGAYAVIADYLTENKISAEIDGFLSVDNNYGVPNTEENSYRNFNAAIEEAMAEHCRRITSDGKTVRFYFRDEGGLLNRQDGVIMYSKNEKKGTPLETQNWYYYIEKQK